MKYFFSILFVVAFISVNAQSKMALTKELVEQQGKYYLRGEPFSGIAFAKNKKGKFITEEPNLSMPDLDIFIIDCLFKKSYADKPDENLAVPDVGST